MSTRKFRFVSPGIFLNEIDNSQIPQEPEAIGPAIVGRAAHGPAMTPVKVRSFTEFINLYGNPIPGGGDTGYREGNRSGPTYGPYGAQAYLAAGVSPVNYVRLLGVTHPDASSAKAQAGWTTYHYSTTTWETKDYADDGGAMGLFIWPSGTSNLATGTLGAVFYVTTGAVMLSGTFAWTGTQGAAGGGLNSDRQGIGTNMLFNFGVSGSGATGVEFKVLVSGSKTSTDATGALAFNFDRDSKNFIRNVMSTNPILTNAGIVDTAGLTKGERSYWLGESYETEVAALSSSDNYYAALMPVCSGSDGTYSYHEMRFTDAFSNDTNIIEAKTGWFFGQDLNTGIATGSYTYDGMTKLFRFCGLDAGRWPSKNIKVSIVDLKASPNEDVSPYGTFSVVIRSLRDTDNAPIILERFDGLSLNPNAANFIGARIGDRYRRFDYVQRVNKEYGQYDNQSNYMRVEINGTVEEGLTDARLLPFGVYGPLRPLRKVIVANAAPLPVLGVNTYIGKVAAFPGVSAPSKLLSSSFAPLAAANKWSGSVVFPGTRQRISASDGGITDYTEAYFGLRSTTTAASLRYDQSIPDCTRLYGVSTYQYPTLAGIGGDPAPSFEYQWVFSLDEVRVTGSTSAKNAYYETGSRVNGESKTAAGSYTDILDAGFDRFTAAFAGGSDGLNIQEAEPFQNNRLSPAGTDATPQDSYEVNTLEVALDTLSDPERLEMNVLAVPGVRCKRITDKVLNICENRGDALGIIDIENVFVPSTETTDNFKARVKSVSSAITSLESRKLNTSYGACYYPWVQIRDNLNNAQVWVPPSVAILGTLASSERKSEVWFAPAGFNRGGLSQGAAGIPVINITEKLTSRERDDLYEANINPIATFPSEGIVVFGQKTLQITQSALDRINVRRLMIYLKKQISRFAAQVLFDQNVEATWNRFKSAAEPFLNSVKSRLGLTEYRLVLDETTTTPDLIDRNIMYAKIFLKPARAIEFIAVDFIITRTGASFED